MDHIHMIKKKKIQEQLLCQNLEGAGGKQDQIAETKLPVHVLAVPGGRRPRLTWNL